MMTDTPVPAFGNEITVLYGTETGNCMRVSRRLWQQLEAVGLRARWLSTGEYRVQELPQERWLLVAISTYDDEQPPEDALGFMGFLMSSKAPRLPQLHYGVLALGASCYSAFCTVGLALDARLAELGATRLVNVGLCDTEFDRVALPWTANTTRVVSGTFGVSSILPGHHVSAGPADVDG